MPINKEWWKMLGKIEDWWNEYSPKGVRNLTEEIHQKVTEIHTQLDDSTKNEQCKMEELELAMQEEIAKVRRKLEAQKNLTVSVIDHLGDMLWAKDLEGKYILANRAFRDKFCYGMEWEELEGKTDAQLSKRCKQLVGEMNHTFGEICANSDKIVMETGKSAEFLEYGKIDGKEMKLVVNKSPIYNFKGIMFGVCGTGRDVTTWYDDLERAIQECDICENARGREVLLRELNKLKFEG